MNADLLRHYAGGTVAVTGGRGYVGSALIQALRAGPARIMLVTRSPGEAPPGVEVYVADIRTRPCCDELVRRADVIFHLAGNTSVYAAAADPAASLDAAVLPLTQLVTAARDAGVVRRIVYASTATVYGLTETLPVDEATPPRPLTVYDLHKLFGERVLSLASGQGVVEGVSLRLGGVYGPSPGASSANERGVLNKMAALAVQGRELPLYGDGTCRRDFVYLDDVVRACLIAGVWPGMAGRSFNVASGTSVTVRDAFHVIADRVYAATGRRCAVRQVPWPYEPSAIEFRNFQARIDRIADACGWRPAVALSEGVDRLIACLASKAEAVAGDS